MAGALMQLVAYGAQDVYLTADPTVTFWKAVPPPHQLCYGINVTNP